MTHIGLTICGHRSYNKPRPPRDIDQPLILPSNMAASGRWTGPAAARSPSSPGRAQAGVDGGARGQRTESSKSTSMQTL